MIDDAVNLWCAGTKCETCCYSKECSRVKNARSNYWLKCDTCWHRNTVDCKNFIRQATVRNVVISDCKMYYKDICK